MGIAAFHDRLAELGGDPGGTAHRVGNDQGRSGLLGGGRTNSGHFRAFGKNWFEIGFSYVPLSPRRVKPAGVTEAGGTAVEVAPGADPQGPIRRGIRPFVHDLSGTG